MKNFLKFITQRWFVWLTVVVILSLVVWFVGPKFAYGDSHPWESTTARLLTILCFLLLWGLSNVKGQSARKRISDILLVNPDKSKKQHMDPAVTQKLSLLGDKFKYLQKIIRSAKFNNSSSWMGRKNIPWYLVMGVDRSGKTTLLQNSEINFPIQDKIIGFHSSKDAGTEDCDCIVTDDAVLLDVSGRYVNDLNSESHNIWLGLLQLIKKARRKRPVNGIVLTISVQDIMGKKQTERRQLANLLREKLNNVYEVLRCKVPVYVVWTKMDAIPGFYDYYKDLSRTAAHQIWGVTYPLPVSKDVQQALTMFNSGMQQLITQADDRLLENLSYERNIDRRALIQGFVQQMKILQVDMTEFLQEIFTLSLFKEPFLWRGCYMTSATQDGQVIDRIKAEIQQQYDVKVLGQSLPIEERRGYFIHEIFKDVVFKELNLIGNTKTYTTKESIIQKAGYAAALSLIGLLGFAWTVSYSSNQDFIEKAGDFVENLSKKKPQLEDSTYTVTSILPILDQLALLANEELVEHFNISYAEGFGLFQGDRVNSGAVNTYHVSLQKALLPRLIVRLEEQMLQQLGQPKMLREALKVYLMLGHDIPIDKNAVRYYFSYDVERWLPGISNKESRYQLNQHIHNLLQSDFNAFDINMSLVKLARQALRQESLDQVLYEKLKIQFNQEPVDDWYLSSVFGYDGVNLFYRRSGRSIFDGVDGIYTIAGYEKIFSKDNSLLFDQLHDDSLMLGKRSSERLSDAEMEAFLHSARIQYLQEYLTVWTEYLNDLELKPFANNVEASYAIRKLAANKRGLYDFVKEVSRQTSLASNELKNNLSELDQLVKTAENQNDFQLASIKDAMNKNIKSDQPDFHQTPGIIVENHFAQWHDLIFKKEEQVASSPKWDQAIGLLTSFENYLSTLYLDPNQGDSALKAVMGSNPEGKEVIQKLRIEASRMPKPLNRWLLAIAELGGDITLGNAYDRVDQIWKSDVLSFCNSAISHRYPINQFEKEDINLADFTAFFGPDGLIDSFFKENLAEFIDTQQSPWVMKKLGNSELGLSNESLAQFERAQRIRESFFSKESADKMITFEITPRYLTHRANLFALELGDQRIHYRHGPEANYVVKWPPSEGMVGAKVIFNTLEGDEPLVRSYPTAWGFFKLLRDAEVKKLEGGDRYLVTFNIEDYVSEFELKANSVTNPFDLKDLSDFQCVEKL